MIMATEGMKISEMPELTTPSGDEYVPVVDVEDGKQINKKLSISKIGGSGGGVGQVGPDPEGTGEIFNAYDGEYKNVASGAYAHAEGRSTNALGQYSHTEGFHTTTNNLYEHAQGAYNKSNSGETPADKTQHSIGIGTSIASTKNAVEVMANGDVYIVGIGGYDGTNYSSAQTLQEVISSLLA